MGITQDKRSDGSAGQDTVHATAPWRGRLPAFIAFAAILSACYWRQLSGLLTFSLHDDFFSYIPLIPLISLYLVRLKRPQLQIAPQSSWPWAALFLVAACAVLAVQRWSASPDLRPEDYLAFAVSSYLLFLVAGVMLCFGGAFGRILSFPLALLLFAIPMPTVMLDWIEAFFQHTSAATAEAFLMLARTPVLRDGLILTVPGISLKVNPECSGVHSTMVLIITSLLAGHLFLKSPWRRAILTAAMVPLAIARNGFRVFVLGELCVWKGPQMIDTPIHHRGGPVFFALSLIPFVALLWWLRKNESKSGRSVDIVGTI